jgi:hypothetical protein
MALQNVTVEIAFTTTPFADPATLTWTDVSNYVESWSTKRGRADEQSQMQAGTATVSLQNTDGRFDPDNGSSPYSPNLLPGVPVRISTTFSGTTYYLFWGFIESWEQHYDKMTPIVVVTASDGLKAVLSYSLGRGYTDMLVSDYGGVVGTANTFFWPWQTPNDRNYYLATASADVTDVGATTVNGMSQTALQLDGAASNGFLYWNNGAAGSEYWPCLDGWFRIDTLPASTAAPKCMVWAGNSNGATGTPNLGFGNNAGADSLSAWVVNYPQNILAAAVADPTSTSGWTISGSGATIATANIGTTTGYQRIWLDNGATDFYGATKSMRVTMAAGSATIDLLSPFTNATAGTAYTFQAVLGIEEARTNTVGVTIDWYNGATFISSTSVGSGFSAAGTQRLGVKATAPAGTTKFQWHLTTSAQTGGTLHVDLAQLVAVAGTFDSLNWYSGGSTPTAQLLTVVASYAGVAPPGQSNSATGWPCYATTSLPTVGTWFHLAVDGGTDNIGKPYSATGVRMPSLWVNGVAIRMWTTGPYTGTAFNAQAFTGLGAKMFFNGSGTPSVMTASCLAITVDDLYVPDGNIAAAGEVTATKALAHYNYGLRRHDFFAELTGARVSDVLDSLGWPSAQRSIDTGTVTLLAQAPDATGSSLTGISLIQSAGTAEAGVYFVGRDGKFNFWDQAHTMGGSPVLTIGDGSSDVHYMGWPVIRKDDTKIFNLIELSQTVTDGSGSTALAVQISDATSQGRYNVRALAVSAPWSSASDMATIAAAALADYKNPATRVASVSVEGVTSNAFASLLPRDIGDYVKVNLVPDNYTGPGVVVNAFIQGISIAGAQNRSWIFTFSLSPTLAGH